MIKVKKELSLKMLRHLIKSDMDLTLVVKHNQDQRNYYHGDAFGLKTQRIRGDEWTLDVNESYHTCVATVPEFHWINTKDETLEIVGYFVFDSDSILFYDIFREGVNLAYGQPFTLKTSLTLKYDSDQNDTFLDKVGDIDETVE